MNFLILEGHRTFWQEVQFEIEDLFQTFIDFFVMIKENTYDLLVIPGSAVPYYPIWWSLPRIYQVSSSFKNNL